MLTLPKPAQTRGLAALSLWLSSIFRFSESFPATYLLTNRLKQPDQIVPEPTKDLQSLGSSFHDRGFGLEDLAAVLFDQDAKDFAHAPAGGSEYFETIWRGAQQRDAAVTQNADTVWVALEGLELKPFYIQALKLLGGVRHIAFWRGLKRLLKESKRRIPRGLKPGRNEQK